MAKSTSKVFQQFSNLSTKHVCVFLSICGCTLVHLFIPFLWLLTVLFRAVAIFTSRFKLDFDQPLTWLDVMLHDNYNKSHRLTETALITLNGDISASYIKQLFTQNVLLAKVQPETFKFPKLRQFQTYWLGFLFWKNDPHFNIDNHIYEIFAYGKWNKPEQLYEEFTCKPYLPERSPWELFVVRNYQPVTVDNENTSEQCKQTLLLWRSHHSMLDALAIRTIIINCLGEETGTTPKAGVLKETEESFSLANYWKRFIDVQFGLFENFLYSILRPVKENSSGKIIFKVTTPMSLQKVKEISCKVKVRLGSVVMGLLGESLSKFLKPEVDYFHIGYVMPLPNHPGTSINHVQTGSLKLPLGKHIDVITKIKEIDQQFLQLKTDPFPSLLRFFGFMAGTLFPWMSQLVMDHTTYLPMSVSNLAISTKPFSINGLECSSYTICVGPHTPHDSLVTINGYNKTLTMVFAVEDRFLTRQELDMVAQGIASEFEKLEEILKSN